MPACTLWLLAAAFIGSSPAQDTTVLLSRGDHVVLQNFSGTLAVRGWDRSELRIADDDGDRLAVAVRRRGDRVVVRPGDRKGRDRYEDVEVRVPSWVDLEVRGRSLEIDVRGLDGGVGLRTVEGDITTEDTSGPLRIHTVEGEVQVRRARGHVEAESMGDDITVVESSGEFSLQSGDGAIRLMDVDATRLDATTVDGDITFSGPVRAGGSYALSVHSGDVRMAIPEGAGATVSVATFDGDFTSDFPITVDRFTGGRKFEFRIGDGRASIALSVFDGDIRLEKRTGRQGPG